MSGYFTALMRSSGIAVGPSAAIARAEPPIGETESTHEVIASLPTPAATAPPVAARAPHPGSVQPLGADRQEEGRIETRRPSGAIGEPAAHPMTPARVPTASPETPKSRPLPPSAAKVGESVVRAAMRWVAADAAAPANPPRVDTTVVGDISRTPSSLPAQSEEAGPRIAVPERRDADVSPRTRPLERAAFPEVNDIQARRPFEPAPERTHHAPSLAIALPVDAGRDDVVEVSIGSINVRVDAPAAHTVARPATPPPVAPRHAARAGSRSTLSRRALRRI